MTDDRNGDREPRHLGLSRRSAGTIMVVIAYVGVVSALVGAVVGWQFLGELSDANTQGLELAEESLTAADASLVVADDIIDAVDDSLGALSSTISAVGDGIADDDGCRRVDGRTRRLAARHARPGRQRPGLDRDASRARSTTRCRSCRGFRWHPTTTPPSPSATRSVDLRADLAPLADDVRAVSDDLDTFSTSGDDLETQLADLAASVAEVQTAVGGTTDVIAAARTSTDDALALAQTTLSDIGSQLALTRLLLVIVAIAIAVGQIVPYWVGRELRESPVVVVADADELDDIEVIERRSDPA